MAHQLSPPLPWRSLGAVDLRLAAVQRRRRAAADTPRRRDGAAAAHRRSFDWKQRTTVRRGGVVNTQVITTTPADKLLPYGTFCTAVHLHRLQRERDGEMERESACRWRRECISEVKMLSSLSETDWPEFVHRHDRRIHRCRGNWMHSTPEGKMESQRKTRWCCEKCRALNTQRLVIKTVTIFPPAFKISARSEPFAS